MKAVREELSGLGIRLAGPRLRPVFWRIWLRRPASWKN